MRPRESILTLKRALVAAAVLLGAWPACAQLILTNVQTVNVTPSGFSVVAAVSAPVTSSTITLISVFSDPGGATNLAGQVGVEWYPLNSGNPGATNEYIRLASKAALRQESMAMGLVYARISDCAPATTYYYRLSVTNTNGQSAFWPSNGPLPAVTTALDNSFVLQSQELFITLADANPPGSIVTLSTSNSPSVLAAVVGDGAAGNQAFFNVNDLLAVTGGANYSPIGSQWFDATVLGLTSNGLSQTFDLVFTTNFSVGQVDAASVGANAVTISMGAGYVLAGNSVSVPITLTSEGALVGLSFVLTLPTNLFTALSVQATTAALSGASLSVLSPDSVQLSFTAAGATNLQGSQQIAQLNFTAAAHQASASLPLLPQSPQGTNANTNVANAFTLQPGSLIIVGPQPVLEASLSGANLSLLAFGLVGTNYTLQVATNLSGTVAWTPFLSFTATNTSQFITNFDPGSTVFFRLKQQ